MNREKIIHDALSVTAQSLPNSVVGDLMMVFPDEIVMKFLISFSGMTITVPKIDKMWSLYRNYVIYSTLSVKNDKASRNRMAAYFGISNIKVSRIFFNYKVAEKKRLPRQAINRAVQVACRSKFEELLKDAQEATKRK